VGALFSLSPSDGERVGVRGFSVYQFLLRKIGIILTPSF
jgi:hypothetical protein